jgi:formylglycine-generating enzyme required for sulfatase activity
VARTLMIEIRLNATIPEFRERASSHAKSDDTLARRQVKKVVLLLMIFAVAGAPRSRAQDPQRNANGAPKSIRNQTGIELVWISPGSFTMGSTDGEIQAAYEESKSLFPQYAKLEWFTGEKPRHQVTIPEGFYMGKYEVTQGQWRAVMSTTVQQQMAKAGPTWTLVGEQGDNYPMVFVSWNEAREFVEKLNALNDGYRYRLPTEAEWEYAARAGTTTAFAFGDSLSSEQANFNGHHRYLDKDKGRPRAAATPVGSLQPNAWGLYDMHGNVYEWCEDSYHDNYEGAPSDGSAWLSGGSDQKAIRGGAYGSNAANVRSAVRHSFTPGTRTGSLGFRVAAVARAR